MAPIDRARYFLISKRRLRRGLAVALFGVAIILAVHPAWLPLLAGVLVVNDRLAAADAIVVLGGGSGDREITAARLYAQGLAGLVITTGGSVPLPGMQSATWASLSAADLTQRGVRPADIIQVPASDSTCADAQLALARLRPGAKRVIIVTDPFHTRRARWLFQQSAPGIEILAVAADPSWFDVSRWWQDDAGLIVVAQEYVKFAVTLVKGCG